MAQSTGPPATAVLGAVEVSRRLGISRKTVYRYTREGIIKPAYQLPSGVFRYTEAEINRVKQEMNNGYEVA